MESLTILHLSDLHYSSSNARDFNIVTTALWEDLKRLQDKGLQPDVVVFCGDLINKGDFGYSEERSDYESVKQEFINPLLSLVQLGEERFFICPGNHDIQRGAISSIVEEGVSRKLVDRASVNSFIDDFHSDRPVLDRMDNFETFRATLGSSLARESNIFFSTYILDLPGTKVGFACINSAWRAQGGKGDYGKLLIAERVIDRCVDSLSDCALRIGVVHHPFEYLQSYERSSIKGIVYGAFHIWLHGHTHEPNLEIVSPFNRDRIIVIAAGTLYNSRDYYNGYSMVRYSLTDHSGEVHLREYVERSGRRRFIPATVYNDEGIVHFTVSSDALVPLDGHHLAIARMRENLVAEYDESILSSTMAQTSAPKSLKEIFVEPPLSVESEHKIMSLAPVEDSISDWIDRRNRAKRTLRELLASGANIVFIGKSESGKTTLLRYIVLEHMEPDELGQVRIPVLLNCRELPRGKEPIEKAIALQTTLPGVDLDVSSNLGQGKLLVLLDDLDLGDRRLVARIAEFSQKYPQNRFILATDEDIFAEMEGDFPDLGFECERVYIHSFRGEQIGELTAKWFAEAPSQAEPKELAKKLYRRMLEIHLPCTPVVISRLLIVIDQEADYAPVNATALLNRLVEILLDSFDPLEPPLEGIDGRIKEHFLSSVAENMALKNEYRPDIATFEEETTRYFQDRALKLVGGAPALTRHLVNGGFLRLEGSQVQFRFRCFCELFTAKRMHEDSEFREWILSEERYLDFSEEIGHLTGIERTSRDVMQLLDDRTRASLKAFLAHLGLEVQLQHFDTLGLDTSFLDGREYDEDATVQRLRIAQSLKSFVDLNMPAPLPSQELSKPITEGDVQDHRELLLLNITILGTVVRNCGLVDRELKRYAANALLTYVLEALYIFCARAEEAVEEMDDEVAAMCMELFELDESTDRDSLKRISKYHLCEGLFAFTQAFVSHLLVNRHLESTLQEVIDDDKQHIALRLMAVLVYSDLECDHYVERIEQICRTREIKKSDFYGRVLEKKLMYYYFMRELSHSERLKVENLLADIRIGHAAADTSTSKRVSKGPLIQKLRAERARFDLDEL